MDTYFASSERSTQEELYQEIEIMSNSNVITGVLNLVSGLLAIVNKHRQVIAMNHTFLEMLGITDPKRSFGLRFGEVLGCVYADQCPGGCGTTPACSSCGAAIAMVMAAKEGENVEQICSLKRSENGYEHDMAFMVRVQPLKMSGEIFQLLFLQDITLQQQRAALERTFFHDIYNMLNGLVGASDILIRKEPESKLVQILHNSAVRLTQEVDIQKSLLASNDFIYRPRCQKYVVSDILDELYRSFQGHPALCSKEIDIELNNDIPEIVTDCALILRILTNMVTNALEATDVGKKIRIWVDDTVDDIIFNVWNHQVIPENIKIRVFQNHYSTKEGTGRGTGSYSMKFFGEKVLGGHVIFRSDKESGTTFQLKLPIRSSVKS